ncbi:FAD-dependent oxidoreductase [Rhodoferax sp.]|uniref:FAD-dependent oxidoreductase n=1 Tax=Rhodoferax sp. TaxID=50421 RepID=UPI00260D0644|nr:FAD-dependent oxidoreductase [Rhodoferax sp.]MDD3935245.1 FAD-dependent oxidoreductase [Rhodoferax sp.]
MSNESLSVDVATVPRWDRVADVIVVGAGVAGTCAALEAHRVGSNVLVIERASGGGGASSLSQGIFYLGGGTAVQQACDYDDNAEEMYKFLRASTSTRNDDALRHFCDNSAAHFEWLEAQGVPFERRAFKGKAVHVNTGEGLLFTGNEKVWPFCDEAVPAPRGHQTRASKKKTGGAAAMEALLAMLEAEHVPAIYDSQVTALVTCSEGRVVGVRVRQARTEIYVEARKGVILAAGSFNCNAQMTRECFPIIAKYGIPLGIPSNDGAGIVLGRSVGGVLINMDGVIATGSIYPPADLVKGIIVNKNGERFVAEDVYHGRLAYFIERQPDHAAYLIIDSEIFEYPKHGKHRLVDGWDTVGEMEVGLGLPHEALSKTLTKYNLDAGKGADTCFQKHADWLKPLDKAPFAAFDISITSSEYYYIALGGLSTNVNGQVLDCDGNPILGLYAVGACTAHFPATGAEYASGLSLGPGSFFGRIAGRHAAQIG